MTQTLYLVRHAKAGERRLWTGDDIDRPLSRKGRKQADLVDRRLADSGVTTLRSSPYARCLETLAPLAQRLGVAVTVDQRLCENEPFEPVLELLAEALDGTVMCSHGDVIPATLAALERRGAAIGTPPDWRKASVWLLSRNKRGRIVHARVWPPPVL